MKAVVIGTGRIGCGVAAQLLRAAGLEIVFVGRNPQVVDHLNRVGRYIVRLVDSRSSEDFVVTGVRAVLSSDASRVAAEISGADIVATAVGCGNLMSIAPLIASGLAQSRKRRTNVLAFENFGSAGDCLSRFVAGCLKGTRRASTHAVSGALVTRVVARREGDPAGDEPLVFVGDRQATVYVDAATLAAPLPAVEGMVITDRYDAAVQRKLFTFSAGHATAAYLGYLKGYRYIHTAVCDPEIRADVLEAMAEGQKALLARYGPDIAGDERTLHEILSRFDNAALNDSIERVGRDPVRKLAKEDRLVGPACLAREAGIIPEKLMLAVAAAMLFCPLADRAAMELSRTIRCDGPTAALCRVSGFSPDDTLAASAVRAYRRFASERPERSQLLSLEQPLWA